MTIRDIKSSKLTNKGKLCMFVGYSPVHAGDCYRMFDPVTKMIHVSRDVRWLDRMYYSSKNTVKDKKDNKSSDLPIDMVDPIDGDSISSKRKTVTIAPGPTPTDSDDPM